MSRKNKIIISVTGILLVLVTLIGLTYAYYLTRINGNTNDKSVTVSLANLELTYSDGNGLIEATNIVPGEVIATKTFSVENTGDKKVINYTVYLDDVINTFENKNDVKLTLTCTSSKGNKCTGTEITYPSADTLLSINDIEVEEKHNYELKVEFIETNTDQSIDMNKELSGNIIIRDLKGTGSEITNTKGTNSISVDNAKLLSNYRIYGNSVQETRSGKNLLNASLWSTAVTENGLTIQYLKDEDCFLINGTTTSTSGVARKNINIKADTSKKYSISVKYISGSIDKTNSTSTNKYSLAYFGKNDNTNTVTNWADLKLEENDTNISNRSIDTSYITAMWFYINDNITFNNYKFRIQLEEGSTVTDYEKYGVTPSPEIPSEIKSVGDLVTDTNDSNYGKYKIGVKTTGKNLIDYKSIYSKNTKFIINDEVLEGSNYDLNIVYIKIPENYIGKVLTFSADLKKSSNVSRIVVEVNVNGQKREGTSISSSDVFAKSKITFTPETSNDYVHISYGNGRGTIYAKNIQLEEESAVTEYEPYHEETTNIYLNEPLRQIGNYTDYIDFKSGKVIRNIAQKTFTKDNNWAVEQTNNFYVNDPIEDAKKELVLCNYQKSISTSTSNENIFISSTKKLNFQTYKINHTVDDLKKWLSDKELIINYILENKKEESISLPNIDLSKTKYINIVSDTNPSSIELDYVK